MQQLLSIWSGLDTRRKIIVVLATVAMVVTILSLTRMATRPGMALLYSGLENGAAGEVVRALEQRGADYQVRGGAIYVAAGLRDELRMTLASEGLPTNTTQGYELLDNLSGFGTTSQMFDAAYWRAKEGELARTIVGSPLISQARVHIANTGPNPFQRDLHPTASVTITASGGELPARHAQALRFLVASAVAGLAPEDVAIIDGSGGLIGALDEAATHAGEDRSEQLRLAVQRLLEARVGHGNAVVEVSVDTVTETESIRERIFDPTGRVAISTDTEERSANARNAASGQVTVASNLPDGDANPGEGSSNQNSESRERVNYEVSETQREVLREPGAIRRLTVAVLINGTVTEAAEGAPVLAPRPAEELEALRELVASAVGFDAARGDVITIKSMAFQPISATGTAVQSSLLSGIALDAMSIIQMAILALVALVLGLFVIRPLLFKPAEPPLLADSDRLPAPAVDARRTEVLTGEIDDGPGALSDQTDPAERRALPARAGTSQAEAVDRLRALISDRQEETVEILRTWLEDREEKA